MEGEQAAVDLIESFTALSRQCGKQATDARPQPPSLLKNMWDMKWWDKVIFWGAIIGTIILCLLVLRILQCLGIFSMFYKGIWL